MRETKFIGQNKEKWIEFEENLKLKRKDPEKLSKLFIQITDDLSYSHTFYPYRSVRVYLNNLAQQIFHTLYKNRKTDYSRIWKFWTDELPMVIYHTRKVFLISFLIFWISFAVGVLSSIYDPEFANVVLGEDYVQMTIENIEKGDPLGVYKNQTELDMFLGITLNNLMVDFITFVTGILGSIGTILVMIRNGIMVGTFQYFFIERDLFVESFLTIWIHGTLEISTIIISGAAGMVLGKGLVFPGSYGRLQAFRISARQGMKILMGVIPITIVAGFLESFMTRYTDAPPLLRLGIILASLLFILTYYVWYPWRKAKKGFAGKLPEEELPPQRNVKPELNRIRTTGEIFTDIFQIYQPYFRVIFLMGVFFTAVYTAFFVPLVSPDIYYTYTTNYWPPWNFFEYVGEFFAYFDFKEHPLAGIPAFLFFWVSMLTTFTCFAHLWNGGYGKPFPFFKQFRAMFRRHGFGLAVVAAFICAPLYVPGLSVLLELILFPLLVLWAIVLIKEETPVFAGIGRAWKLYRSNLGELLGIYVIMLLVSLFMQTLVGSPLFWFLFDTLQLNIGMRPELFRVAYQVFFTYTGILAMFLILPATLFALGLFYYRQIEVTDAYGLKEKIKSVGSKRRVYGLEQEV